jgi:DNA-binding PadR family transcriptional regulator
MPRPRSRTTGPRGNHDHDGELYAGLIRLHILHHAAAGPVFGLWIIKELARHGYRVGPGTLYPVLHALEHQGYLSVRLERGLRGTRRTYRATAAGRRALIAAKAKVWELFRELFEPASVDDKLTWRGRSTWQA